MAFGFVNIFEDFFLTFFDLVETQWFVILVWSFNLILESS